MSNILRFHPEEILADSKLIKPKKVAGTVRENENIDPSIEEKMYKLVENAKKQAERILEAAAREAEQLRKQINEEKSHWESEKKSLSEQAWNEGYQSGLEQGRKAGKNEYSKLIDTAAEAINQARSDTKTYIASAEQTILELAMASAETILGTVLTETPEKFLEVVKKGIAELKDEKEVEIYVHPSKLQWLVSSRSVLESIFPREVNCYFYPKEELGDDDCVIECETVRIDVSIDSQLKELKERLVELLSADPE
ncbi:flagellar assembly protein FliH [Siminovitchia sediminis]|uniref:Flagellar assembly protein FliH n=1 Tax=Siminovitchia sediminis TaxID=1274353 RepID=A0ABW4KGJ5_9BACI